MSKKASRSRSPARAVPSGDLPEFADELIVTAAVVGLGVLGCGGTYTVGNIWGNTVSVLEGKGEDVSIPDPLQIGFTPINIVFLLHMINMCQNRGGKMWIADILDAGMAVYINSIVLGLLTGTSLGDSLLLSNDKYIMVTAVWYLTNHSIAGVVPNVWTLIKDSPVGNGVQKLLNLATVLVVTSLIIKAATPCADGPDFQFKGLVKALLVGTASTVIPSTSITRLSAGGERALLVALIVMTKGFQEIPFDAELANNTLMTSVEGVIGLTSNQLILVVTAVMSIFGSQIADLGIPLDLHKTALSLVNKVFNVNTGN